MQAVRPMPEPAVLTDARVMLAPVWPSEMIPKGRAGCVMVNFEPYLLQPHADLPEEGEPVTRGWRFVGAGGQVYDVDASSLECDCPDCSYRQRMCKHVRALLQLGLVEWRPPQPAA